MKKQKLLILFALCALLTFSSTLHAEGNYLKDIFSVNFYRAWPGWQDTDAERNAVLLQDVTGTADPAAGFGDWNTTGWLDIDVGWSGDGNDETPDIITSTRGGTASFYLHDTRNGNAYNSDLAAMVPGANAEMMEGHGNGTEDPYDGTLIQSIEVRDIPFAIYDVIFYLGTQEAQQGDGSGKYVFNNGPEKDFQLPTGSIEGDQFRFDGTFTQVNNGDDTGNYILFEGVTGSSFTFKMWGNGFNHIGLSGFQFGIPDVLDPYPADGELVIAANPLALSWNNVDPNAVVDVYFSTDPCDLGDMIATIDTQGEVRSSVDVDASALGTYYWQVISNIPDVNAVPSPVYTFETATDVPPTVEMVTPDQMTWSGEPVPLEAAVTNLGPSATVIGWTHDAGSTNDVAIADGDTATPTVTITKIPYNTAQIVNAGFETPALADGDSTNVSPAGWTISGFGGSWNPGAPGAGGWEAFDGVVPEGDNVLWLNNGASATSVPGETVQADATYTLSVDVGFNVEYGQNATYLVQLLAGDNVIAEDDNLTPPEPNNFETIVLNYTAGADAVADPNIGLPLKISLACTSTDDPSSDAEFDNVSLTSDIPFPPKSGVDTVTMTIFVNDEGDTTVNQASVEIDVYDSACHMAREGLGLDSPFDLEVKDCKVNDYELGLLADAWLTDTSLTAAASAYVQASASGVYNGEFQMYKPGTNYMVPGELVSGYASGVGDNIPTKNGGIVEFADGTQGMVFDMPGWNALAGNTDFVANDGVEGVAFRAFGTWASATGTTAETKETLGTASSGTRYTISAMLRGPATPVIMDLLADGQVVSPSAEVTPIAPGDWTEISRTYEPNAISAYVGKSMSIVIGTPPGVTSGNLTRFDNVAIAAEVVDANMPDVDAGDNIVTWSGEPVTLAPIVTDNDTLGRTLSYLWTAEPADGVVFSDPVNPEDPNSSAAMAPTVTITKPQGDPVRVALTLKVFLDGEAVVGDYLIATVFDDACQAYIGNDPQAVFAATDFNTDCITNLTDYAELAFDWLLDYEPTGPLPQPEE